MNNTVKGIIVLIIAANVIYFLFSGSSGDGGSDCEQALADFNISPNQLDCDFICEEVEAINARKGGGPPKLDKVKSLMTLKQCLEDDTGTSCSCPETGN